MASNGKTSKRIILTLFIAMAVLMPAVVVAQGVYYSNTTGRIYVDGNITLANIREVPVDYFEIRDNVCYLKRPLEVQGILYADNRSCDVLRMYPGSFIKNTGEVY